MALFITGVGALIHLYSVGYMHGDEGYARFFVYLNLFAFSMLVLVLADSFLLSFLGWEGVGACSYFLISFWFERDTAASAGKKAFVTNRVGDFGFMIAMFLMFSALGSLQYGVVLTGAATLSKTTATAIALLLFLGAVGKSAQLPLYVWLPDAMEGPTPVSALIHAATMVTAGVYIVARSNVLYAGAPEALEIVGAIGGATAFFAATIALCQNDLKRLLAYSTISQLGYMFLGCGAGVFAAGIFHLMTHAFFKSLLFLAAGSVMHAMSGQLDMRKMGGLRHKMGTTFWTFLVATLAISGVPGFSGFFSKDEILAGAYEGPLGKPWLYWLGTLTAGLTAFYMFRAVFMTFCGRSRVPPELAHHVHESRPKMTAPLIALAFFSVVAGYVSWPKPLGGSEAFDRYLARVFESSEALLRASATVKVEHGPSTGVLMAFSLAAAGLGILVAWQFYLKSTEWPERLAERFSSLYRVLVRKYYVDE